MSDIQTTLDAWRKDRTADARQEIAVREGRRSVGRPKFPRGKAKAIMLHVRLTESEMERIKRAADSDAQDLSSWVRDVLLRIA